MSQNATNYVLSLSRCCSNACGLEIRLLDQEVPRWGVASIPNPDMVFHTREILQNVTLDVSATTASVQQGTITNSLRLTGLAVDSAMIEDNNDEPL